MSSIFEEKYRDKMEELYPQTIELLSYCNEKKDGNINATLLQRRFRIGYTLAALILERLENDGYISGYGADRKRKILRTN